MIWIDASGVVAMMTNLLASWNLPARNQPSKSMGMDTLAFVPKYSTPRAINASLPFPAIIMGALINLFPKPLFVTESMAWASVEPFFDRHNPLLKGATPDKSGSVATENRVRGDILNNKSAIRFSVARLFYHER